LHNISIKSIIRIRYPHFTSFATTGLLINLEINGNWAATDHWLIIDINFDLRKFHFQRDLDRRDFHVIENSKCVKKCIRSSLSKKEFFERIESFLLLRAPHSRHDFRFPSRSRTSRKETENEWKYQGYEINKALVTRRNNGTKKQ